MSDKYFKREWPLHLLILPGVIITVMFSYIPMTGIVMAFQKYLPAKGIFHSKWIDLDNFQYLISIPGVYQVLFNTVFIAIMKIIAGLVIPVTFALLLNEISNKHIKKAIQTSVYLPHFLSWVILSGILIDILSPGTGFINQILTGIGLKPVFFLGDSAVFPYTMVATDVWKEFGFSAIIYLAALSGVDVTLYEAAVMDGANRWKQTWHVTLPGITPIIVLMTALSLGNVLNAGFDQIFNLYSPVVYSTGDIIDTLIYRIGIQQAQYSLATAAGLFKSVISFVLIATSYKLADKYANYKIF